MFTGHCGPQCHRDRAALLHPEALPAAAVLVDDEVGRRFAADIYAQLVGRAAADILDMERPRLASLRIDDGTELEFVIVTNEMSIPSRRRGATAKRSHERHREQPSLGYLVH